MTSFGVQLKNVQFSYGKNNILNFVNLNLPKGSIYGLLGPSGCGKTTLLDIVLGLKKVSFGNVLIFGFKPGTKESGIPGLGVGYMPQEIALENAMSIEEFLNYFGGLLALKTFELKKRIDFLINLLELPDRRQVIGSLSGGEQRRVSLAISILHKPRLLLLDEPTVGVDPLLRNKIWSELRVLSSSENVSVLITTHYIEEARLADNVGFLNDGKILVQDTPSNLLNKFNTNTLEKVFYLISNQKNFNSQPEDEKDEKSINYSENSQNDLIAEPMDNLTGFSHNLWNIYFLFVKYLILLKREPNQAIFLFLLPQFVSIMLWHSVGVPPKNLSTALVIEKQILLNDFDVNLANMFKTTIDTKIMKLIEYSHYNEAIIDARKRRSIALIYINENFSSNYLKRDVWLSEFIEQDDDETFSITNNTIKDGSIYVTGDFTEKILLSTIRFSLLHSFNKFRQLVARNFSIDTSFIQYPVKVVPLYGEFSDSNFFSIRQYALSGFIVIISFSLMFTQSMMSLLIEKFNKLYKRSKIVGVKHYQVFIAKLLIDFIYLANFNLVVILNFKYILKVPFYGSELQCFILLQFIDLVGFAFGIIFSTIAKDIAGTAVVSAAVLIGAITLNGIIWPIDALPYFIRWISKSSPLYRCSSVLHEIMFRSSVEFSRGLFEMIIWFLFFSLIALFSMRKL